MRDVSFKKTQSRKRKESQQEVVSLLKLDTVDTGVQLRRELKIVQSESTLNLKEMHESGLKSIRGGIERVFDTTSKKRTFNEANVLVFSHGYISALKFVGCVYTALGTHPLELTSFEEEEKILDREDVKKHFRVTKDKMCLAISLHDIRMLNPMIDSISICEHKVQNSRKEGQERATQH